MSILYTLSHAIRTFLPESVKRIMRALALALTPTPAVAPVIPQSLLEECRVFSDRYAMLPHLPKQACVAEIGTLQGYFARQILVQCAPRALHLLDIDFSQLAEDVAKDPHVRQHQGLSHNILTTFPTAHFDWIYIDGDHRYDGVKRDIAAAIDVLKPGGLLIFNDFARVARAGLGAFGVHQAVSEFMLEAQWPAVYFCFNGDALYDIALRKPLS